MRKIDIAFALARIISDGIAIFVALVFAYFFRMSWFPTLGVGEGALPLIMWNWYKIFAAEITSILILIFAINGRYSFGVDEKTWDEMKNIFWIFTTGLAIVIVLFFFQKFTFFSRLLLGVAWISGITFLLIGRQGVRWIRKKLWGNGFGQLHVLVLGSGSLAKESIAFLKKTSQYQICGVLIEPANKITSLGGIRVLGTFDSLEKYLEKLRPTDVLLASDYSSRVNTAQLARLTHVHHARFQFLPDESSLDLAAVESTQLGEFPMLKLHATRLGGWSSVVKSVVEQAFALGSLIALSPVILFVAAKIKLSAPKAPVFYGSKRIGISGNTFKCWKFRTMVPNADTLKKELMKKNERKGGVLFKMKNDPRITPFGEFLRKSSIDELPQLWNIFMGEMSLIGPRPHLPEEVEKYESEHKLLLSIKPGLTGYAQIHGRSSLSFEDEMRYELFYLKNWNPWLDIIIFFKTIKLVCSRKDAE
jgi:exopolysaccharide biosynthesis polyprenyl glycosylphosphotransferase